MKTKKVLISGLAFNSNYFPPQHWLSFLNAGEDADMARLQFLAKQGWVVTKIESLYYVCEQTDPTDLKFAIDYRTNPDDDYFEVFASSGWNHVDSVEHIHLFSAPLNAVDLYSDSETRLEIITKEVNRFKRYSIFTGFIFFPIVALLLSPLSNSWPWYVHLGLFLPSMIAFIFAFMPYLGYLHTRLSIKKKHL